MQTDALTKLACVGTCLFFDEVDSTNTLARQIATQPAAGHFDVIVAGRQRAGRGRNDAGFCSGFEGGLWVSLIVPLESIEAHFSVNRALSLAIGDAIGPMVAPAPVYIKWPNDIYIGSRKVCGILLESIPGLPTALVAGFRLNVNIEPHTFPLSLHGIATSLLIESRRSTDLPGLLLTILQRFDTWLRSDPAIAHQHYRRRLYRLGTRVRIEEVEGVFEDVLDDGRIVVRTGRGIEQRAGGSLIFL